jgi:hypothetical protein
MNTNKKPATKTLPKSSSNKGKVHSNRKNTSTGTRQESRQRSGTGPR